MCLLQGLGLQRDLSGAIRNSSDSTSLVQVPIVADDADEAILAALCEIPSASSSDSPAFPLRESLEV
jgi:hypothetical protein